MDRRTALRAGVGTVLGSAAVGLAVEPATAGPALGIWECDWSALAGGLSAGATLYRPGEASYQPLSVPFNHRYASARPAGILAAATPGDVQHAVRWTRERGVPVAPRSSLGHNYAGYSTTPGLVLLMSRMRRVRVRAAGAEPAGQWYGPVEVTPDAGTITVAAGVVNADLRPLLASDGVFIPAGRCPTVGVAGLVLGGACRGGAGNNFGVHTSFTFSYELLRGQVTFFEFRWGIDAAVPAMVAMQEVAYATAADPRFDCRLGVGTTGRTPVEVGQHIRASVIGQFYGSAAELAQIVAPALAVGTPAEQQANRAGIREVSPAESAGLLSATTPVDQFGAKSAILADPLSGEQLETVVERLRQWPGSRNPDGAGIALFGLGGRVNDVPPEATAFVHRDGLFVLAAEAAWADDDPPALGAANLEWLDDLYWAIFPSGPPKQAYQNFPDPQLLDWQSAYYGANYPRLVAVKREYDPGGFFWYEQGIGSRDRSGWYD